MLNINKRVYISNRKVEDKLTKLIYKLYNKVSIKCKALNEEYKKRKYKFFDEKVKLLEKTMKTREHKEFKVKSDVITKKFNNNEVFKQYVSFVNKHSNLQLMDKKLLKQYKAEKKIYLHELNAVFKKYYNTPMYLEYLRNVKNKHKELLQTKEATNINICAFKNYSDEYKVIIRLLLKNIKNDKRNTKVYTYLKKINIKTLTLSQYKKIIHIFNRISRMSIFDYV